MKKHLALILLPVLLGCAQGKILMKFDDFKKAMIVRMDLDHAAYTDARLIVYHSRGGSYLREIAGGKKKTIQYQVRLFTTPLSKDLKAEAYVKIDDSVKKLQVSDLETDVQRDEKISQEKTSKGDTQVKSYQDYKILTATLHFTPEMEPLILRAETLQYRLYAQTDAITLAVSAKDLSRIKAFIRAPEEGESARMSPAP